MKKIAIFAGFLFLAFWVLPLSSGMAEFMNRITDMEITNSVDPGDIDGDDSYADQVETVAGRDTDIKVTTNFDAGTVAVTFVGIDAPDCFGNNAHGVTVSGSVDITFVEETGEGTGDGTFTFVQAGYYEIRGASSGVTYTKLAEREGAIIGKQYALRVRPDNAGKLGLRFQKEVVNTAAALQYGADGIPEIPNNPDALQAASRAIITVLDGHGNLSGYSYAYSVVPALTGAMEVDLQKESGDGDLFDLPQDINVGEGVATLVTDPDIMGNGDPWSDGTVNVTAAQDLNGTAQVLNGNGLTESDPASIVVCPDQSRSQTHGELPASSAIAVAQIEGENGEVVKKTVGTPLILVNITAGTDANDNLRLQDGDAVTLVLGTHELPGVLVYEGLQEEPINGFPKDLDGDWVLNDMFSAIFTLPDEAIPDGDMGILEVNNENFASFGIGYEDEYDYEIITEPAEAHAVRLVNPNGFDMTATGYDALFGGTSFNIPGTGAGLGAHFQIIDAHGNNLTFGQANELWGILQSDNLLDGNHSWIKLGTDQNDDDALLTWLSSVSQDEVTLYPQSSFIDPIQFPVVNIGDDTTDTIEVEAAQDNAAFNQDVELRITTRNRFGVISSSGEVENLEIILSGTATGSELRKKNGTIIPSGDDIDTNLEEGWDPGYEQVIDGQVIIDLHTGDTAGAATVTVQIDGTIWGSATVNVDSAPVADFSATPLEGGAPLIVQFTDMSTGGEVTEWHWNFGDGETSDEQNPTHMYAPEALAHHLDAVVANDFPRLYDVTLEVTGPGGDDVEEKEDYITVNDYTPLVANFSGDPRQGSAPLTVDFTDLTEGVVQTRTWKFYRSVDWPDIPFHTRETEDLTYTFTFEDEGTYTVELEVVGYGGQEDKKVRFDYIVVEEPGPVQEPVPDVKVNGLDGPVYLNPIQNANVTAALSPGDYTGQNAEWWIGCFSPLGNYWFTFSGWTQSSTPVALGVLPIGAVPPQLLLSSPLPVGQYSFFFILDTQLDGLFGVTWYDFTNVAVSLADDRGEMMDRDPGLEFERKIMELIGK